MNELNSEILKLGKLLCNNKLTISTAESCTGGMISSSLISYSGISEVYLEGFITYSNESKNIRLGVLKETLEKFGAVSKEVAFEMVKGLCEVTKSDIGIVSTGIAGPEGGSLKKPVGLVYIGVSISGKINIFEFKFSGSREEIRNQATLNAIKLLVNNLN